MLSCIVLIESDWNLKQCTTQPRKRWKTPVLIESDWNLKLTLVLQAVRQAVSINRIRLEFKVFKIGVIHMATPSINRIRLEFKEDHTSLCQVVM